MQLLLNSASTGTVDVSDTVTVDIPLTKPVLACGVEEVGALIEVPAGINANVGAQLIYRLWATDDSQSVGSWNAVSTAVSGPGKVYKEGAVTGSGLYIQLGLRMTSSSGDQVARGLLRYPVVVTK